jgi:F-type H+-transporting ATPase subunit epsilon
MMAQGKMFQCSVITPEGTALECEASFVAFPAHDGEMGVLFNRAPLVAKLGIGMLRVDTAADAEVTMLVEGGFAEVINNRLTVLTQSAHRPEDIDAEAAERELEEAKTLKPTGPDAGIQRELALKRALIKLRMIGRG